MNDRISLIAEFFDKPNIVVWGCGQNGKNLLKRFPDLAECITEFVDTNFLKIGEQFLDKWEIKAPVFLDPHIHNVIVTPYNSKEIVDYLEEKGFVYTKNCIFYSDILEIPTIAVMNIKHALTAFKNAHPDIHFITTNHLALPKDNLTAYETYVKDTQLNYDKIYDNPKLSYALMDMFECEEDVREVLTPPKSYCDAYGTRRFEDTHGKLVNTSNGHRVTVGQPEHAKRSIYILPHCMTFGTGASDKGTIASQLQEMLNKFVPEEKLKVENYGYYLWNSIQLGVEARKNRSATNEDSIAILNALPVKSGDIIIFFVWNSRYFRSDEIDIDFANVSTRPHNYGELFFDNAHHTENGYRLMADKIFEYLKTNDFFHHNNAVQLSESALPDRGRSQIVDENTRTKLKAYQDELSKYKPKVGAIVMNCNPFTFGHRYLIEQATAQVTQLFVFVVQEDKSFFPFEDRLALVKEGVKDLPNVTVIPSGQFIISTLTFEEYFNKSEIQERTIDSSMDVNIFGQEIAPCLNIQVRFIGEEPFDLVTRQYNETMKAILPKHGIEVVEIPRKEQGGEAISASRVRTLLKEKKFDEIKKLVPQTTLNYLKKKFG